MVFRWSFSVLSTIWEEAQNSSHAGLCLFTQEGRVANGEIIGGLLQDAKGSVNNRPVNVADCKKKEYQTAKIHKTETKVELGESPDFW